MDKVRRCPFLPFPLGPHVIGIFPHPSELQITASLSLMRRLPPNKIEQNLNGLLNLIPEETDELLQRVDQPLKEGTDPETVSAITVFLHNNSTHHCFHYIHREESTSCVTTTAMVILTGTSINSPVTLSNLLVSPPSLHQHPI